MYSRMAETDSTSCRCSNISIMQLFHELKQRFPKIPDQIVSKIIQEVRFAVLLTAARSNAFRYRTITTRLRVRRFWSMRAISTHKVIQAR